MIDFLVKHRISNDQIMKLLSMIFDTERNNILILPLQNFSSINNMTLLNNKCLCMTIDVRGDAAMMLQLYRYSADDDLVIKKVIHVFSKEKIACYIPKDNFTRWYFVDEFGKIHIVREINENEDEENLYYFALVNQDIPRPL